MAVNVVDVMELRYGEIPLVGGHQAVAAGEVIGVSPKKTSRLTLRLAFRGADMSNATHYGNLHVSVKDNRGNSVLLLKTDALGCSTDKGMAQIPERPGKASDNVVVDLNLEAPARQASMLTLTEGSIELRLGRRADLVFKNISRLVGTELVSEDLKAAQVSVRVLSQDNLKTQDVVTLDGLESFKGVALYISGDRANVCSVDIIDTNGRPLADDDIRKSVFGGNGKSLWLIGSRQKVSDENDLRVKVIIPGKTILVPFELAGVRLP